MIVTLHRYHFLFYPAIYSARCGMAAVDMLIRCCSVPGTDPVSFVLVLIEKVPMQKKVPKSKRFTPPPG
jgi:hypothetical protein